MLLLLPASAASTPDSAEQLQFGVQAAKKGLWREARFRWERALKLSPSNPRILNNLAVAHETAGDFEKARTFYQQALRLEPDNRDIKQNYELFTSFFKEYLARSERGEAGEEGSGGPAGGNPQTRPEEKQGDAPPPT